MLIGPYETNRCYFGDALDLGKALPDESIHCIVTSPPYWGLRDYGVKGQLGLEKTPEEYVERLVAILREHRRALRADGTLWLNLGDCYAAGKAGRTDDGVDAPTSTLGAKGKGLPNNSGAGNVILRKPPAGLKPKDLVGVPWMVAFALRADGWWLRQENIWNKLNPMPESVTDRPTRSHEQVFLLAKSGESIFWTHRNGQCVRERPDPDYRWVHKESDVEVAQEPAGDWKKEWRRINLWSGHDYFYDAEAIKESALNTPGGRITGSKRKKMTHGSAQSGTTIDFSGEVKCRNKRSVWTISTKPYPDAHFATFPPDLIKPCILAGTSERGCCPECGAQWVRKVERSPMEIRRSSRAAQMGEYGRTQSSGTMVKPAGTKTIGWRPSCECGAQPIPAVVLDPFLGSGTTGQVCQDLGRNWIGFDLNEEYAPSIEKRTRQQGLF